jgi:hypothetical protein
VAERLAVQGVKHGVARSVGSGSTAVGLATLAILEGLTTKGTLVDLALLGTGERETKVFELSQTSGLNHLQAISSFHTSMTALQTQVSLGSLGTNVGKDNSLGRLAAHVMNGILVTEPIATLDSVVHVPTPVILGHVSEGSVDATLSGDGMRASREELGDTSNAGTSNHRQWVSRVR